MNYSAMKKIILLAATFFSLSFFANAQSLDKALERLETVRSQKGEQTQEFLTALDTVIWAASMTGDNSMAISYRQQHLDIVKLLKGENCFEVADDIWRLGNVSFMLGDSIGGCNYYVQAAEIFDKVFIQEQDINDDYLSHYSHCLYRTFTYYYAKSDIENFTRTVSKYERIKDRMNVFDPCNNIVILFHFSYSYEWVGDMDKAEYFSNLVVESCSTIDSCNYKAVLGAFIILTNHYFYTNQPEKLDRVAKLRFEMLESSKYSFFNEKIWALYYIAGVCDKDVKQAIAYGKQAEKLLVDSKKDQEELFQDSMYYKVVDALALKYGLISNYTEELPCRQICCSIFLYNNQKNTKEYYDAVMNLFICAYNAGEYALVQQYGPILESMIFSFSETPTEDAFMYVGYMGDMYMKTGNYQEGLAYCDEALGLLPQLLNGDALKGAEAQVLSAKAQVCIMAGKKQEAIPFLAEAKRNADELAVSLQVNSLKAFLFSLEGLTTPIYEEAIAKIDTALLLNEQLITETIRLMPITERGEYNITDSTGFASAESIGLVSDLCDLKKNRAVFLMNKGLTQYNHGVITEAYHSFLDAATLIKDNYSENSTDYIMCQNNIAACQIYMGNYSDAINTIDNNKRLVMNNYGTDNLYYGLCLQNFSAYYHIIGDDNTALHFQQEAADIYKKIYGENSERYGQELGSIGMIYLSLNKPEEAYKYLTESAYIVKTTGTTPSFLCFLYRELAIATLQTGGNEEAWDEGWNYYEQAFLLTDSIYGLKSMEHAQLALSIGVSMLNFEKGKYKAYERFLDAAGTMLSIGQTSNPFFIQSLIYFGLSWLEYDTPITDDYTELLINSVKDYYENNFAFFASNDRELLWKTLSNIKNTIISTRIGKENNIHLYDYSLFYKSLLLSASNSIKKEVFCSDKPDLINRYNDIEALQRTINKQSFEVSNNNQPLETLYEMKNSMERTLIAELRALGYSPNDENPSYSDVTRALKENEIAVEFENYQNLKEEQCYYVALVAKSSLDNPIFVELCTEDELMACMGNPNVTYSTDDLYRLLWQPLLEYVGDTCTVYFSPSGMLHTIALESMHTPDGSCLSDKYNLVRLTSTRELCKAKQPKTYKTGAIYGGLQYDVEQQRMAEVAAMNKTELEKSPAFALRGEDRGNWNYLQGTKDEAEHIAGIMRQANIRCNLFEGDLGSEESFKALSGGNTDIIHLATHGYFLEGEKADMNDFMKSLSPLARQKTDSVIDPLLRSGLILSGGNRAWLGKEVPEGIEDGVLTALEISTMNLSGTDMVVMSACETGLGDITSDGVFGLQRAFKMAGVQTLVMSLWKVDDNATSLMMQTFYEHLLSGMSKREAFKLAQAAVRAKYSEPYYWAGFIMLD
jgi:CHAT domain-containing protein